MSDIKRISGFLSSRSNPGSKFCLATVVRVEGSAYRQPGAKMIIDQSGAFAGNISGGCLEMDVIKKAKKSIESGVPKLLHYDNSPESKTRIGASLGCNGIIEILIEPIESDSAMFRFLSELPQSRSESIVATVIETTDSHKMPLGSHLFGNDGFDVRFESFDSSGKRYDHIVIHPDKVESTLFLEKIKPLPHLFIFGSGFDTYPLIRIADELGWLVTVTSDSYAITIQENFLPADRIVFLDREEIGEYLHLDEWSYAVLMSHSYDYDHAVLKQLVRHGLPYIGLMGPRSRTEKILREIGGDIDRTNLFYPVGLDLGGDAPPEIALSIISEIQSIIYKRNSMSLKLGDGPIHVNTSVR